MLEKGILKFKVFTQKSLGLDETGNTKAIPSIDMLDEKLQQNANFRLRFVKSALSKGVTSLSKSELSPIIEETYRDMEKSRKKPSWDSVCRWIRKYCESGYDIRSLVDNTAAMGNRARRVDDRVLEIVARAINETYLARERATAEQTFYHAVSLVNKENEYLARPHHIPNPSKSLIRREIKKLNCQYQPPRSLEEIDADLDKVSREIMELLAEVHS